MSSVCCTELGRPAQDLSLSSLCAQRAVVCAVTSQEIDAGNVRVGRLTTDVVDAEEATVQDLVVLGSINFIPTGGATPSATPFTFCADAPLEISATSGCFAISPGTADTDTVVYDSALGLWSIRTFPSTVLAGTITLTFGTGAAFNVDPADHTNVLSGMGGNPPSNPGLNPVLRYIKVGTQVECDVKHETNLTVTSPAPALSYLIIKNLPFRGGVAFSGPTDECRGNVNLLEYVPGVPAGARTQAVGGFVGFDSGLPAAAEITFSMSTTVATYDGTSKFRYQALQDTP